MTLTPSDLESVCSLMWGKHWRHELEDQLGINPRTIRRIMAGTAPIPEGLVSDIETALRDHMFEMDKAMELFVDCRNYG